MELRRRRWPESVRELERAHRSSSRAPGPPLTMTGVGAHVRTSCMLPRACSWCEEAPPAHGLASSHALPIQQRIVGTARVTRPAVAARATGAGNILVRNFHDEMYRQYTRDIDVAPTSE